MGIGSWIRLPYLVRFVTQSLGYSIAQSIAVSLFVRLLIQCAQQCLLVAGLAPTADAEPAIAHAIRLKHAARQQRLVPVVIHNAADWSSRSVRLLEVFHRSASCLTMRHTTQTSLPLACTHTCRWSLAFLAVPPVERDCITYRLQQWTGIAKGNRDRECTLYGGLQTVHPSPQGIRI